MTLCSYFCQMSIKTIILLHFRGRLLQSLYMNGKVYHLFFQNYIGGSSLDIGGDLASTIVGIQILSADQIHQIFIPYSGFLLLHSSLNKKFQMGHKPLIVQGFLVNDDVKMVFHNVQNVLYDLCHHPGMIHIQIQF